MSIFRGALSNAIALLVATSISCSAERVLEASYDSDAPAKPTKAAVRRLVVVLTFDDGNQNQYDYAVPALEAHGMRGTFFVIRDTLDATPRFHMSTAEVRSLYARGHEIGSHSLAHQYGIVLANMPFERVKREICDSRARWIADGIDVRSYAYPWGERDATVESLLESCGYDTARIVGGLNNYRGYCGTVPGGASTPYVETIPPLYGKPFEIRASGANMDNACTVSDLENIVKDAEEHLPEGGGAPGVLVLMFHHICPGKTCSRTLAIDSDDFNAFLDWLAPRAESGTVVDTMSGVFAGPVKPPVLSGTPLVINGTFESYLHGGASGAPDCWQRSTSGTATTAWSSMPGRTGLGQRVVVGSYQSGTKVRLQQDMGGRTACAVPTTADHSYTFSCWYKSDAPVRIDARQFLLKDKTWPLAGESTAFAASPSDWAQAAWTTPTIASGTIGLSFGVEIADGVCNNGCLNGKNTATLMVDDCTSVEN